MILIILEVLLVSLIPCWIVFISSVVFVNDVSDRYDNIDPILSSFTEKLDNINKNQDRFV